MKNFSALFLALAAAAHAGPRTSASYTVVTDTTDGGGRRASSAAYTNDGSAGAVAGISTVAAPAETAKHGYLAQLTDVTALTLTAVSPTVNESATDQLAAWQFLDDATFLAVPAASVAWSVVSGPLTSISAGGLATAGVAFQNTSATAQGVYLGKTGTLALTVLDTIPDNFGSYAGDGLGDGWQVQYFGQNNPLAAPLLDPDGDGQTNAFEFTAGLVPTDPTSRFTLSVTAVPGQPTQKNITFTPRLADRSYTVSYKTDLSAAIWTPLSGGTTSDSGLQRTITDSAATGARKFYHIEITKP